MADAWMNDRLTYTAVSCVELCTVYAAVLCKTQFSDSVSESQQEDAVKLSVATVHNSMNEPSQPLNAS